MLFHTSFSLFIMIQDVPYPFLFRFGNLPFIIAEIVFLVIGGIIGVIEIIISFVAAVVIAVAIVQLPNIFHRYPSFRLQKTGQNPCKQAEAGSFTGNFLLNSVQ